MNISSAPSVQTATLAAQGNSADSVNLLVLKKALDMQASLAKIMLQDLQQPALATQGAVGTQVNTFA